MKFIKNIIGFVVVIAVMPAIILTVKDVTELKGVKDVHFELLSEENDEFIITTGTYNKLIEHKSIIKYDIESSFTLITHEELEKGTLKLNDELYNEIIDRETNPKIVERVVKVNLWEHPNITSTTNLGTHYAFSLNDFVRENDLKEYDSNNTFGFINKIPGKVTTNDEVAWWVSTSGNMRLQIPNVELEEIMQRDNTDRITALRTYLYENDIYGIFELAQSKTRLAEQYDLSTFKLTFDDDRIRILFDIDEGYYLWEITNDDKLIPINGQHEIGNVWTVKFYIYKIQQPLIRTLVLLIPLIMISGLLFYLFKLLKIKD